MNKHREQQHHSAQLQRQPALQERRSDPYHNEAKYAEPTMCPDCNAVYHQGHWKWSTVPAGAHLQRCPSCQRMYDRCPAGFLSLSGPFLMEHHSEIMNLLRNVAERAKSEHPLKTIIAIEEKPDGVMISTAEIHLARELGEAVQHAYKGELDYHYNSGENLLRVNWVH